MPSLFERLNSSLPVSLPRGRALLIRSIPFAVGSLLLWGLLVAFFLYFKDYLERPIPGLAPYAYGGVFFASMLTSAAVVFPTLTSLPLAVAAATMFNPLWVGLAMALGSTLGETTAYMVGYLGGKAVARAQPSGYVKAEAWMRRYGVWAVLLVSLFPLMLYDLTGIAAGVLRLPLWKFWIFTFAGRFPRALVELYSGGKVFQWIFGLFD